MPLFFPCPNCHFAVQPPLQASANAKLRCPVCQFEILAGDLLQGTSRKWIVIEDPGGEDLFCEFQSRPPSIMETRTCDPADVPVESFPVDGASEELSLVPLAPESLDTSTEELTSSSKKVKDWKRFKPITHEEYQRRRRASKPIWLSIFQVLLGGAAAVPVALLIIWHLLDRDFMGAGPLVGKYVPWIVPERFRPFAGNAEDEIRLPRRPSNTLATRERLPKVGNHIDQNGESIETPLGARPEVSLDVDDRVRNGSESLENVPAPSPPKMSPFANAVFDLQESINGWEVYQGSDRNRKRILAQRLYASLQQVAELMSKNPEPIPSDQVWLDKLIAECQNMLKNQSVLGLIEQGAAANLKSPPLPPTIVFIGEIEEMKPSEAGSDIQLVPLKTMKSTLSIRANEAKAKNLFAGQKYLLFCTIQELPSDQEANASEGVSRSQSLLLNLLRAIPVPPST